MEITNIIITVSISTVVGGAAGFSIFKLLAKRWVHKWFEKDLKKYEHQLDMLKMQKSLKYSNVYTKQAEIITQLYADISRIALAESALRGAKLRTNEEQQQDLQEFGSFVSNASTYAITNGIYLNKDIRLKVISLYDQLAKELILKTKDSSDKLNDNFLQEIASMPDVDKSVLLEELIVDFQNILGINEK